MSELYDCFKDKNILVTGHTGFKGSWMSIWLLELGANVIGYSLNPLTNKDNFVLSNLKEKITHINGDIRNKKSLLEVFNEYRPDIVFHFAAQPIVKTSYENPCYTYDVNVMGTLNVLECIRKTKETTTGIIITSDKCYKNKERIYGYREIDELGGRDLYSSSKSCAEILVSSYRDSFFNIDEYTNHYKTIATVRAGNVIGGGDWSQSRLIPDCIKALENSEEILIRNPLAIRPWQHVLEPLSGYLNLTSRLLESDVEYSGCWNFGPKSGRIYTVEEIVKKVIKFSNINGRYTSVAGNQKKIHESSILNLDSTKANYYLDWHPKWDINSTIEKTMEWYNNYNNKDVYDLCIAQINEYSNIEKRGCCISK